jgi:hypothetical protein
MYRSGFSPNGEPRVRVWKYIEYFIQKSQHAFSAGNAAATDLVGPFTIPLIYVGNPLPDKRYSTYNYAKGSTSVCCEPLSRGLPGCVQIHQIHAQLRRYP